MGVGADVGAAAADEGTRLQLVVVGLLMLGRIGGWALSLLVAFL